MEAEFRFQASSPVKGTIPTPTEAITPASDLIQSWGGKPNKFAYAQVPSTPGEQLIGTKVRPCPTGVRPLGSAVALVSNRSICQ